MGEWNSHGIAGIPDEAGDKQDDSLAPVVLALPPK